jgi:hypothetical protein
MTEPASTSLGHSYDRSAISQWLDTHHVCPKTQMTLHKRMLTPNLSLRSVIEAWVQEKEKEREREMLAALVFQELDQEEEGES